MLDEDQKIAFELANGHNLIISGQAGTGKSFLLKYIVKDQREKQKNVAIVCSTGIASTLYEEFGAKTLHKWAGIEDRRHLNEEIIHLVQSDERFMSVKHNIQTTDLLIIDEVSMVSAKTFNKVEVLCRKVRDNNKYFGGIQVILSGDFYQLPPVPNKIIGDSGSHCFKLPWFDDCFPHKVQLNIIHRQSETALIQCINALEKGEVSNENVAFLNSLDRPLPNEDTAVHLYARNYDVDIFNYNKLQQLQGDLKTYKSTDVGSDFYLRKFLAPKNLGLKVGCHVMLVRNLSDTLVNGLCGTVTQLNSDSVDVKFIISNKLSTVTLKPVVFTTYDPADKEYLAKRTQIPLKLAYAITIHKAQGMSLKRVVVNCEYCFQPGQIGVAVGRAEQVEGLRENNGEKNDDSDSDSDDNDDDDDSNDNTCTYAIDDNFNSDSDFSDSEIEKLEVLDSFIETNVLTKDQSSSQAKAAIDSVFNEYVGSHLENDMKSFKMTILEKFSIFDEWYQSQISIIEDIGLISLPEGEKNYTAKQQHDFFMKFHKHLNSEEYVNSVKSTISMYSKDEGTSAIYYQFMTAILFYLERRFFEDLPSHLNLQEPESIKNIPTSDELSSPARGKIRYISGYVLAKLKHNLSIKIRNSLFAVGSESKIAKLQDQMNILSSLCSSYDVLLNSSIDPESLEETKRKQNERESLTNITDVSFSQFRRDYLTFLKKEKGKALRKKVSEKSKKVVKSFNMQFLIEDKSKDKEGSHLRLKSELMQNEKFLSENSFTKKELLMLCLMYNVKISTQKRKEEISSELGKAILKSDFIPYPDKSDVSGTGAKPISNIIVSAAQTMDSEVPGPSNVHVASTSTGSLASELQPTIQNKDKIQSNKRKTSRRGKGKGKGKSRKKNIPISDESDDKCTVCNKPDIGNEDWICCDACTLWYHRDCANLQDDEIWTSLSEEGAVFTCPLCQ
ncbi:Hypothetical predicted protein [Mytilus galloprovincialis]|uniref:ATP-dependent DNA helicase n=1 Tax=Mytilus galloprovincialis TaxID=29158 RepID=A0A8B6DXY7_MYTGA|nr:Hypothetical predicted protein [Mytilus galloprovincialis]